MIRNRGSVRVMALVLALMCLFFVGCSGKTDENKKSGDGGGAGKVTRGNVAKLKNDMSKDDVEKLLGTGKAMQGVADTFVWGEGLQSVTITFKDGKAVAIAKVGF